MFTLTVEETCKVLHIGENAVLELINSGDLPAARLGKAYTLTHDDVMEYLRAQIATQTAERRKAKGGDSIPSVPPRNRRRSRTDAIIAALEASAPSSP